MDYCDIGKFVIILTCFSFITKYGNCVPLNLDPTNVSYMHEQESFSRNFENTAVITSTNNSELYQSKRRQFAKEMGDILRPVLDGLETALENVLDKDFSALTNNMSSKDMMLSWYEVYKDILDNSMRRLLPLMLDEYIDLEISSECRDALLQFILDLQKGKMWTLKMLDAAGKPGGGIFSGNTYFLGSYDQCLDISVDLDERKTLNGQYCLVNLEPSLLKREDPVPLIRTSTKYYEKVLKNQNALLEDLVSEDDVLVAHVFDSSRKEKLLVSSICTPSLCTINDINAVFKRVTRDIYFEASTFSCETKYDHQWSIIHTAFGGVFGGLLLLVLIGTTVDYVMLFSTRDAKNLKQPATSLICTFFRCYSVRRNFSKLLPPETRPTFAILGGLKAMTMAWIIIFHTYTFAAQTTQDEKISNLYNFTKSLFFHGILNGGIYSVDTFLVISAMLISHGFLSAWQKQPRKFPAFPSFVRRYFRLMPSSCAVMGLMFFVNLAVQGPFVKRHFDMILGGVRTCTSHWWTNVVAISNFYEQKNMCLGFLWYICVDLQLFIMFLLPIYILLKWPNKGIMLHSLLSLSFIGINYFIFEKNHAYQYNYPSPSTEEGAFFFEHLHSKPYLHVPVYAIGVLLGYLIFHHKGTKISKFLQIALWCSTCAIMLTLILITHKWQMVFRPSKAEWLSLLLLGRTVWAFCISWIIYACLSGRGGIVNAVLSSDVFVPFGRLAFSSYLMNMFIILGRFGYARNVLQFSHYNYICEFIVNFMFTHAAALVLYLVVESPITSLQMHFCKKSSAKPSENRDMLEAKNVSKGIIKPGSNEIPKLDEQYKATITHI